MNKYIIPIIIIIIDQVQLVQQYDFNAFMIIQSSVSLHFKQLSMDQDYLRYYYEQFYPYELMQKWLTYNSKYPFSHRQLSFEYEWGVQRYVTFNNFQEMQSRMTKGDSVPLKVDAGAIWTGIPIKDNKDEKTIQRQFVFDFDMNDYDDVRTCCVGKKVCVQCWKMLLIAVDILKTSLTEDFGFEKFMYVFSGGRGMHIWVCDKRARLMSDQMRKSSVDYLELVTANDKASSLLADGIFKSHHDLFKVHDDRHVARQQLLKLMHPHIARSLITVKKWFTEIFEQQKTLNQEKCRNVIYKILETRNKKLMERVQERWQKCEKTHKKLWEELCNEVDHYEKTKSGAQYPLKGHQLDRKYKTITFIQEEIMLSFLYPRMDYNVSTMQNHLLKLPFSVHPTSKKISVPLFYHQVQNFDPKNALTIEDLMKDLQDMRNDKESILHRSNNTVEKALQSRLSENINEFIKFIADL